MLSGPCKQQKPSPPPVHIQTKIVALWELEEPQSYNSILPAFPLSRHGDMYEVGLLWKGAVRPSDNKDRAIASVVSLCQRLKKNGEIDAYRNVLIEEYSQLEAIEKEPEPQQKGYYMPHHAVVRQGVATTKLRVVFNASAAKKGTKSLGHLYCPIFQVYC